MDLSHRIQSFLDEISLQDMMDKKDVLEVATRQNKINVDSLNSLSDTPS